MKRSLFLLAAALSLSLSIGASAQDAQPRKSPHDTASVTLAGQPVTISYGRPYLRGRKAVGGPSLVPYGLVWRTGADEATKLTTAVPLMLGDLKVPAGSYSLFTLPTQSGWTLIVNKTADQWGAFSYDKAQDLGRTAMEVTKPDATVEQFTIKFNKTGDKTAVLSLLWENSMVSVPVKAL